MVTRLTPSPAPHALSPAEAVALFAKGELIESPTFMCPKPTVLRAYNAWALEAPGRPTLSMRGLTVALQGIFPSVGHMLSRTFMEIDGVTQRPTLFIGLRMVFPARDDPFEAEWAKAHAPETPEERLANLRIAKAMALEDGDADDAAKCQAEIDAMEEAGY